MISRSTRVELGCRFAIRALLLNEDTLLKDTLLQVRNFFTCILSLSLEKAIMNAIFLGLNLILELCN